MKRSHQDMAGSTTSAESTNVKRAAAPTPSSVSIPKISRRIRACAECKGHKIKCEMGPGNSVCTRCQRLALDCVVNKSLQTLLDSESEWKTSVEESTLQLQAAVSDILRSLQLPALVAYQVERPPSSSESILLPSGLPPGAHVCINATRAQDGGGRKKAATVMAMTRENSQELLDHEEQEISTLDVGPMGSLYEVTKLRSIRNNPGGCSHAPKDNMLEDDFISRGDINLEEAEELFTAFTCSLNHYLWGGVALVHDDLASVRRSSSLLSVAILTVAALHIINKTRTFDICYEEFVKLVSNSMLDRWHDLDEVRALCIGAFWLTDVSWKLSGHAVRIATELNLHQSFQKALGGQPGHFERARLWYLLYVCDHHFSIAYGRPPVIHEDQTITDHETFLQLPGVEHADFRLHSQVALFIILTRIYNSFRPDIRERVSEQHLSHLRQFDLDLERWRLIWQPRLAKSLFVGTYPATGVILHAHFAQLQLHSLALRGLSPTLGPLSPTRQTAANSAIASATQTLTLVLENADIRNSLVGVPLYLHTMIAFAAVFLLKVAMRWSGRGIGIEATRARELVGRVVELLRETKASERHLNYHIASGLEKMLERFREVEGREWALANKPEAAGSPEQGGPPAPGGFSASNQEGWENYGFDENYFPVVVYDYLSTQIPN